AWRTADGAAGLSAHRPLLCRLARKSGAVGRRAALVPHLERSTAEISGRPATDPARPPAAGLAPPATVANRGANCCRAWSQLPDLGSLMAKALGIDPDSIDPRAILASIAADPSMPPTARVAAAKALLRPVEPQDKAPVADKVTERALALLGGARAVQ